jgi:hypothetical protein
MLVIEVGGVLAEEFVICGDTNPHRLTRRKLTTENHKDFGSSGYTYTCDCPLSNGSGKFCGMKQVCSHQLTVQIVFPDNCST